MREQPETIGTKELAAMERAIRDDFGIVEKYARGILEEPSLPPIPPPPIDRKFPVETSVEYQLHKSIMRLFPETLSADNAQIILDLASGARPIFSAHKPLTEHEQKFIWEPQIEAWWKSLGEPLRQKFLIAARRVRGDAGETIIEDETRLREARMAGYRRLLSGIFTREPMRMYDTYAVVSRGDVPFCPEGFSVSACVEWRSFLRDEWFAHLSVNQKNKIAGAAQRAQEIPQLIIQKERELDQKNQALQRARGVFDHITHFFSASKRAERSRKESERETLAREVRDLEQELSEYRTSRFIDEQTAHADSALHAVGDRTGVNSRVLDAPQNLFRWSRPTEKTATPQSLDGYAFNSLSGTRHNIPGVVERWMIEGASARAAAAMTSGAERIDAAGGGNTESAHELLEKHRILTEVGRPTVDWDSYLFSLQQSITVELARSMQRGQQLHAAVEREPLAGLLKAYRNALPFVQPEMSEQTARVTSFMNQVLAQTESDLRLRMTRGGAVHGLVPEKDAPWIVALLEEHAAEHADVPKSPDAHAEHADGYVEAMSNGAGHWYYERTRNGSIVHVWEKDNQDAPRYAGHFEGSRFFETPERRWKYVRTDGTTHEVGEFEEGVCFKIDGTVVAHKKNKQGFTDLGKLSRGFGDTVFIGQHQKINVHDSRHTYFVSPRNELLEYHASVNEMRVLGTIES